MKVIGLTGNIGSGKSTVADLFKELGAELIDADQVARNVVQPGTPALVELTSAFGEQILNTDKTLNRQVVADIVFNSEEKRGILNNIIHPRIYEEINKQIDEYRLEGAEFVFIEAALLVEKKGLINVIDNLIVVSIDKKIQAQRLIERGGINPEQIDARIDAQISNEEKTKLADYIIDNNHDLNKTREQVNKIWEKLIKTDKHL
jgi:dephospho-CoA kinase